MIEDIEEIKGPALQERNPHIRIKPKKSSITCEQDGQKSSLQDFFLPGKFSIHVKTWGCSHNSSDSEYMAGLLHSHGYRIVQEPEKADLWVLNSCTVKNPSEQTFVNQIKSAERDGIRVVLAGCVPQAQSSSFLGYSVIGVQQIDRVVEVVEETLKGNSVQLLDPSKNESGRKGGGAKLDLPKIRKNPLVEIIPINTGCLNQCTYCKTKHARGNLGSYPIEEIVARARQVFAEGVTTIHLTSEDLGAYGRDLGVTLSDLLFPLVDEIPEGCMLRLGMTNPPYIMEQLESIVQILNHPRVYSFLHIPVQAASDRVLYDMRREYTIHEFKLLCDYLLKKVPGITIATDIICGFPTETEEDFDQTLSLIDHYKFPIVHISQFYPRPGTPAAKMPRLPTGIVKERSRKLTKLFESYTTFDQMVGQKQWVLVTDEKEGQFLAHNKFHHQVMIPKKSQNLMGKRIQVQINSSHKFHLIADQIQPKSKKLSPTGLFLLWISIIYLQYKLLRLAFPLISAQSILRLCISSSLLFTILINKKVN